MLFEPMLVTYKYFPVGSTVTAIGLVAAAKGESSASVKAPLVGSMLRPDTVLSMKFVT